MTQISVDSWSSGEAYEAYMGRWSRAVAQRFVEWLAIPESAHWLEVGCGTGALTRAICERCQPASVLACDPSATFIEQARANASGPCSFMVIAPGSALPGREGGYDAVVSGLVLNFLADPKASLLGMRERCAAGGTVAAYIWDYADGVEFLRSFWEEAVAVDASAVGMDESRRFAEFDEPALLDLFRAAGLSNIASRPIEIATNFHGFDDYWRPFLGGVGPAPSYLASLDETQREELRRRLEQRLLVGSDGLIRLRARAWVVRGKR